MSIEVKVGGPNGLIWRRLSKDKWDFWDDDHWEEMKDMSDVLLLEIGFEYGRQLSGKCKRRVLGARELLTEERS